MKKFIIPAVAVIMLFVVASCTKEVTKVAPGGDGAGAQSIVYTIEPEDWAANDDSTALFADFNVSDILTPAIFDHGAVMVYLSFADDEYEALPEVIDLISYTARHYKNGRVTVAARDVDGYAIAPPGGEVWAKIVVISAQKIQMHPNVNLDDYNEVKEVFHLK